MALSIMQPYIFPYIGYFHLIEATDKIVFYDDVTFIKGGWINRNKILVNGKDSLFTIPLLKASSSKLIKDTELHPQLYPKWKKKFWKTIEQNYSKAPHFKDVYALLIAVLDSDCTNISDLAIHSITQVYAYLNQEITWTRSSVCSPETTDMDKADRIIQIVKDQGFDHYINAIGGQALYDKEDFKNRGVRLSFVQPEKVEYPQFDHAFVPWLSIIDLLMFNDREAVKEQFSAYKIV